MLYGTRGGATLTTDFTAMTTLIDATAAAEDDGQDDDPG